MLKTGLLHSKKHTIIPLKKGVGSGRENSTTLRGNN